MNISLAGDLKKTVSVLFKMITADITIMLKDNTVAGSTQAFSRSKNSLMR
jgi:hypothetical protein